jgi:hypothetical protein
VFLNSAFRKISGSRRDEVRHFLRQDLSESPNILITVTSRAVCVAQTCEKCMFGRGACFTKYSDTTFIHLWNIVIPLFIAFQQIICDNASLYKLCTVYCVCQKKQVCVAQYARTYRGKKDAELQIWNVTVQNT